MGLLSRILGRGEPPSRLVAKDRLQLVLVHDRISIPPAQLAAMKDELLAVVGRYFDVDSDGIEITFTQSRRTNRLVAAVPVFGALRRSFDG
ncbi:MAG: cell division topological specificity factor MinE [Anaerolineae bacterium]